MVEVLNVLAQKHNDWINMAKSFGVSDDDAKELVQEMYLRLHKYVDDPERIMYNDDEVNTFYVYVTLRNIYLSGSRKISLYGNLDDHVLLAYEDADIDKEMAFEKIVNRIRDEVEKWYWYDKKLWEIHFDNQKSMRSISTDTTISLSSIFNTLKRCKIKIRDMFNEDVEDYKNRDYDRI